MNIQHYTYRVTWSPDDNEHVGLCAEFPSLSWLAKTPEAALRGVQKVVAGVVADMLANGENVPDALAERRYSGEFKVRDSIAGTPSIGHDGRRARGEPEPPRQCKACCVD